MCRNEQASVTRPRNSELARPAKYGLLFSDRLGLVGSAIVWRMSLDSFGSSAMADAFILRDDGTTSEMSRIRCVNEERELQSILEKNHDLLPGSQIDPDNPRRWLLIKREMP